MTNVTGGLVAYEDGRKSPEEYGPTRKVRVELSFTVEDGEDAQGVLNDILILARGRVRTFLSDQTVEPAGEAAAPATTRKRRTKAEIEADEAAAKVAEASTGGEGGGEQTSVKENVAPPADEWETPAAEITDEDLNSAVTKKNATLADPPKIRTLIGTFNPDPTKVFQLKQIAPAQRADFLAKLEALT